MIIRDKIKMTEHYKSMDTVKQIIYLKKNTVERIRLGFCISGRLGFDEWVRISSPRESVRIIVGEILEGEK